MILPSGVTYAEVGGSSAVSKVCVFEVGGASHQTDAWLLLWEDGVSVHPVIRDADRTLMMDLSDITSHRKRSFLYIRATRTGEPMALKYVSHPGEKKGLFFSFSEMEPSKNTITMATADRCGCRSGLIG